MSEISTIFTTLQSQYQTGKVDSEIVYYFSLGNEKIPCLLDQTDVRFNKGKPLTVQIVSSRQIPKLFGNMVLRGKKPGTLDIARGKVKFSDMNLVLNTRTIRHQSLLIGRSPCLHPTCTGSSRTVLLIPHCPAILKSTSWWLEQDSAVPQRHGIYRSKGLRVALIEVERCGSWCHR